MTTPLEVVAATGVLSERPPLLVDVGAAGRPPAAWRLFAPCATYVAFDPDARELSAVDRFGFRRFTIIDKAVTDAAAERITFHLAAGPECSSLLRPNWAQLDRYGFSELFEPVGSVDVAAVTLDAALDEQGLGAIDWLKLDSQGKDLDLYASLGPARRRALLAVDVEPGIVDFYEGENTFAETHRALVADGFWLSRLDLQRFPRVARATRRALAAAGRHDALAALSHVDGSPTAAEARYLRSTEHLAREGAPPRDWACLWLLAMADRRPGFALDVATELTGREGTSALGRVLLDATLARLPTQGLGRRLRAAVPAPVRRGLRAVLTRWTERVRQPEAW